MRSHHHSRIILILCTFSVLFALVIAPLYSFEGDNGEPDGDQGSSQEHDQRPEDNNNEWGQHPKGDDKHGHKKHTPTQEPTSPPTPTDEPTPLPTATEEPTLEPSPTDEPIPEPTATDEPTLEPTQTDEPTPTDEPTLEPTATEDVPELQLNVGSECSPDGSTTFYVTNVGAAMTDPVNYVVTASDGNVIDSGSFQLGAGEIYLIELGMVPGEVTLSIDNGLFVQTAECIMVTDEVTPPDLSVDAFCDANGGGVFNIVNEGGDMTDPLYYYVVDSAGNTITDGFLQLAAGASLTLNIGQDAGFVVLIIDDGLYYVELECTPATSEPTATLEPTATATLEPTLTPTATLEPTATATLEPTPTPTVIPGPTPPPHHCRKHVHYRWGCHPIKIDKHCDGNVAVFEIHKNHQMEHDNKYGRITYHLFRNHRVVSRGSFRLTDNEPYQVRYAGRGDIKLTLSYRSGYAGYSHLQSTIKCRH